MIKHLAFLAVASLAVSCGNDHLDTEKPIDKQQSKEIDQLADRQTAESDASKSRDNELGNQVKATDKDAKDRDGKLTENLNAVDAESKTRDAIAEKARTDLADKMSALNEEQKAALAKFSSEANTRMTATEGVVAANKTELSDKIIAVQASFEQKQSGLAKLIEESSATNKKAIEELAQSMKTQIGEVKASLSALTKIDEEIKTELKSINEQKVTDMGTVIAKVEEVKASLATLSSNVDVINFAMSSEIQANLKAKATAAVTELDVHIATMRENMSIGNDLVKGALSAQALKASSEAIKAGVDAANNSESAK